MSDPVANSPSVPEEFLRKRIASTQAIWGNWTDDIRKRAMIARAALCKDLNLPLSLVEGDVAGPVVMPATQAPSVSPAKSAWPSMIVSAALLASGAGGVAALPMLSQLWQSSAAPAPTTEPAKPKEVTLRWWIENGQMKTKELKGE